MRSRSGKSVPDYELDDGLVAVSPGAAQPELSDLAARIRSLAPQLVMPANAVAVDVALFLVDGRNCDGRTARRGNPASIILTFETAAAAEFAVPEGGPGPSCGGGD